MADTADTTPASAFPTIVEGQIGSAIVQTVGARDLHRALGVGKVFGAWIAERIAAYDFKENTDFVVFSEAGRGPSEGADRSLSKTGKRTRGGQNRKEYALTLDMAKELAMVERNEKGKEVRRYFIACERKLMEAELRTAALPPPAPVQVRGYTRALPKGPRPARPAAAPLPRLDLDGFAIVRLGGEILVVDTNRFDIGPGVRAVTIGYKGSATVEDMTEGRKAGVRTNGMGDRNFTVPDVTNKVTGRRPFWVFGTVVASQPVARPETAGERREAAPKAEAKSSKAMPAAVMARGGLAGLEVVGRA